MDGIVVALGLLQQLHEAGEDGLLDDFGWARMPDGENEGLRVYGRVIAELHLFASQVNELAGQLAGSANVLCDDEEEIFVRIIRADMPDLSCEFAGARCPAQRQGNFGR